MTDTPTTATPPLPAPVKSPEPFTKHRLVLLVRELVYAVHEPPDVMKMFNLSPEDFVAVQQTDEFKRLHDSISAEWDSAANTEQRAKLYAAALVEEGLPAIAAGMMNRDEPLNHRVEAAKYLKSVASIGDASGKAVGEMFKITINLGSDTLSFEKNRAPTPPLAGLTSAIQIEQSPEASNDAGPVQAQPEGSGS